MGRKKSKPGTQPSKAAVRAMNRTREFELKQQLTVPVVNESTIQADKKTTTTEWLRITPQLLVPFDPTDIFQSAATLLSDPTIANNQRSVDCILTRLNQPDFAGRLNNSITPLTIKEFILEWLWVSTSIRPSVLRLMYQHVFGANDEILITALWQCTLPSPNASPQFEILIEMAKNRRHSHCRYDSPVSTSILILLRHMSKFPSMTEQTEARIVRVIDVATDDELNVCLNVYDYLYSLLKLAVVRHSVNIVRALIERVPGVKLTISHASSYLDEAVSTTATFSHSIHPVSIPQTIWHLLANGEDTVRKYHVALPTIVRSSLIEFMPVMDLIFIVESYAAQRPISTTTIQL